MILLSTIAVLWRLSRVTAYTEEEMAALEQKRLLARAAFWGALLFTLVRIIPLLLGGGLMLVQD